MEKTKIEKNLSLYNEGRSVPEEAKKAFDTGRFKATESLKKALDLLEISLLDHIIISDSRWYSFADECVTEFGI